VPGSPAGASDLPAAAPSPTAVRGAPTSGDRVGSSADDRVGSVRGGCGRRAVWVALGLVLAVALALRLWGIRQGLPYAFNSDEDAHFVPRAVGMLTLGWNPHYFANPPAYTDLLRLVFSVWFGGRAGVDHAFATNPTAVFTVARVSAALLGTLAVWLLYVAGARLFDRAVALLAAALEAVAFLPVFYAHLALNDVPTLAPLTLSLLGTAGVLRRGRARDYLLAGVGLGLGCATKYTAGIVLLPLLAAAAAQYLAPTPRRPAPGSPDGSAARRDRAPTRPAGRPVMIGLALAGAAALASFLIADPYSVLDFEAFKQGLAHQSSLSGEAQGKLGAPHESGVVYYLWSLTWGLGWVPAVAALGGACTVWRRERALGWMLVPAPLLYLAFMGAQGRYFGRWLLPVFPILCLLAAFFALQLARTAARFTQRFFEQRTPPAERLPSTTHPSTTHPAPSASQPPGAGRVSLVAFTALAVLALCAQGVLYSVHSGLVLSRADTRALTRAWMVAHIPAGTPVVVEPVVPDEWVQDVGHPTLTTPDGDRWPKYQSLLSVIDAAGALRPEESHVVTLENYELTLSPALIPYYEREGFCWVVSGTDESGRAFADPPRAPHAVAYYRALARQGTVVYHVSPYARGAHPVAFNFDWSFDYYPLAYRRPGPEMTVYRLRGGRCARG
jgi:Dolichyl-phosphate-mannose-protein mannosyltransferase